MVVWGHGYGATTPLHQGLWAAGPLVPPIISRGAPRQATWETSVSEGRNYGREMADQFRLQFRLPHKSQGFTCRKSVTWDRRLYFPSEERRAVDFFARKIRWLKPGSNPWSWLPEASILTTRPLKPLLLQSDSGAHSSEAFIAEHFECIVCWLCSHQLLADYIHMLWV
jgi:hypothetical protein